MRKPPAKRSPSKFLGLAVAVSLLVAAWPWGAAARAQGAGEAGGFMRVELPAGGAVRVENRFGAVAVEVWDEGVLGVAAEVDGVAAAGGDSPVRLEKTERALAVVVSGAARAKLSRRVDLRLRVPPSARLSISTSNGAVEVLGTPALLDAQTVAGGLRLRLAAPADADVMARSLSGEITVRAGLVAAGGERVMRERFNARLGAGRSVVRLSTVRGYIDLGPLAGGEAAGAASVRESSTINDTAARREQSNLRPREQRATGDGATNAARETPSFQTAPNVRRQPPVILGSRDEPQRPAAVTPAPATATPGGPEEVDPDEVITVDTHMVTLNLSVVDRQSGRGMAGLERDDFKIFEDNVEQPVSHFEASNAPFDLLLLLDLSGSTAKMTDVIRASALRFVESVRPRDRVGVVAFASAPQVVSPLTDDKRALRARVSTMGAPTGDTKLYDAIDFAMGHLAEHSPKGRRRAIILMSDGLDSVLPNVQGEGSALKYEEVRSRVQEFDGLFYTIWTDNTYDALSPLDIQPETFDLVYDRMEELAKLGGGLFYEVEKLEDLAGAYERVMQDLGTVYSVSYLPTNKTRDGRWRAVRVRLPRRPDAIARGKSGYRAK